MCKPVQGIAACGEGKGVGGPEQAPVVELQIRNFLGFEVRFERGVCRQKRVAKTSHKQRKAIRSRKTNLLRLYLHVFGEKAETRKFSGFSGTAMFGRWCRGAWSRTQLSEELSGAQ